MVIGRKNTAIRNRETDRINRYSIFKISVEDSLAPNSRYYWNINYSLKMPTTSNRAFSNINITSKDKKVTKSRMLCLPTQPFIQGQW